MDTLQFLKEILPSGGIHYLVTIREYTGKDGTTKTKTDHHPYEYLVSLAEAVEHYEEHPKPGQLGIYHACASYKCEHVDGGVWPSGDPKLAFRVPENHDRAKSLWVDIDCGADKAEKGAGYATKADAVVALSGFCRATGFPSPMVVDSGGGLHCYWPFTKDIPHTAWKTLAVAFKACIAKFGLLADPTRTADFSSILRPVGSFNRKREPRQVKVVNAGKYRKVTPEEMLATVQRLRAEVGFEIPRETPSYAGSAGSDIDDLIAVGQQSFPPYSAELAAGKCNQVRTMRDMRGDVSYDHWRGVIGFIKISTDDDQIAFDWSSEREATGHSQNDVGAKLTSWNSGPPTCAFFQKCNPEGCAGCEWSDKVKSPAALGRSIPQQTEAAVEEIEVAGKTVEVEIPPMPRGYDWRNGNIIRVIPDKDGVPVDHAVTNSRLWAVARVLGTDFKMKVLLRMLLDGGRLRDFYVDAGEIAAGGSGLLKALGAYEVYPSTRNANSGTHLTAYLRDEAEALKTRAQEVNTFDSYGWKDDFRTFVAGSRAYTVDGREQVVFTADNAAANEECLNKRTGSKEGWAKAIDTIYNRPGMEALQYTICSAFGAPLGEFQDEEYKGIPLALTSDKSGKGKSTVCKMALYAFGDAEGMTLSGDKEGVTPMARTAYIATFKNLPILIDEITKIDPEDLGGFLYAASNGKDKVRLGVTAGKVVLRKPLTWNTSIYLTANTNLQSLLASVKINSVAEAVRVFEIPLNQTALPRLHKEDFRLSVGTAKRNAGYAGEAYLKHIVQHQDRISTLLLEEARLLPEDPEVDDNHFRFYRMHIQCTLAAARLMTEIGIIQFDVDSLRDWAHGHLKYLTQVVDENNSTSPEDAIHQMVSALTPDVLVTYGYNWSHKAGGRFEVPVHRPRGEVVGRYILGNAESMQYAGWLIVSKKAVRDWCLKNRIDPHTLETTLKEAGALVAPPNGDDRVRITRGVEMAGVQARCFIINTRKFASGETPLALVQKEDVA